MPFLRVKNMNVRVELETLCLTMTVLCDRRCLSELFSLPGEADLLGLPRRSVDCVEKVESGEPCDASSEYTFVARPKQRGRKKKSTGMCDSELQLLRLRPGYPNPVAKYSVAQAIIKSFVLEL